MKPFKPYIRNECDMLPPAIYGYAYTDYMTMRTYWYPIPVNYIVRSWRYLNWKWNLLRSRRNRKRERYEYEVANGVKISGLSSKDIVIVKLKAPIPEAGIEKIKTDFLRAGMHGIIVPHSGVDVKNVSILGMMWWLVLKTTVKYLWCRISNDEIIKHWGGFASFMRERVTSNRIAEK